MAHNHKPSKMQPGSLTIEVVSEKKIEHTVGFSTWGFIPFSVRNPDRNAF